MSRSIDRFRIPPERKEETHSYPDRAPLAPSEERTTPTMPIRPPRVHVEAFDFFRPRHIDERGADVPCGRRGDGAKRRRIRMQSASPRTELSRDGCMMAPKRIAGHTGPLQQNATNPATPPMTIRPRIPARNLSESCQRPRRAFSQWSLRARSSRPRRERPSRSNSQAESPRA